MDASAAATVSVAAEPSDRALPVAIRGLGRLFGRSAALSRVDLDLHSGEALLLLGPNGSGKSTLLRIVAGLLHPSAGHVRFGGRTTLEWGAPLRSRIGYLAHRTQIHGDLCPSEALAAAAALAGLPPASIAPWCRQLGLTPFLDRPLRRCSRGQAQRVALARVLLLEPDLLLLDEPTNGLDDDACALLLKALADRLGAGAAVLCATHEPERLAPLHPRRARLVAGRLDPRGDP
jgi:heme ABC exporter ATP-binding subunit CcmA